MGHERRDGLKTHSLFGTRCRALRVRRRVFHRLSSAKSPRGPLLLRVASGIPAKAPRLPRITSWLRLARAGGFPGAERLLQGVRAISRNRVSWAALVFLQSLRSLEQTFLLQLQAAF